MRASGPLFLAVWLLSASLTAALSFSSYAFLFPDVPQPLGLGSCAAFRQPVALSGRALQESGFESGVAHAREAVRLMDSARKLAQFQDGPLFWAGANPALSITVSHLCHRLASESLGQAVLAVQLNWEATDRCIAELEFAGVRQDGPLRGLFLELEAERLRIENRTLGTGLGGRVVEALVAVDDTSRQDGAFVRAVETLVGPESVLDRQVAACRDIRRVLRQVEFDAGRLEDDVDQRLQDGQRLGDALESEKISLVPEYAFSLQQSAAYARTGWVQSFPQALQSARQALIDAQEEQRKAQAAWKTQDSGYIERALAYWARSREAAEQAVVLWTLIDQTTQRLESELLRQVESLRQDVRRSSRQDAALTLNEASAWQAALLLSERPLPSARGERILHLADAVRALSDAREAMEKPAQLRNIQRPMRAVEALLTAAVADGIDVSYEKSQLAKLDVLVDGIAPEPLAAQLDKLRDSIMEKARARFGRLDPLLEQLEPFRSFVSLPPQTGSLMVEENMGHLSELEKQLTDGQQAVERGKNRWLQDHLNARLELVFASEPIVSDAPARQSFRLAVSNDLDFGSESPVLLKRPEALAAGAALSEGSDFRLLPDGFLLPRVAPHAEYRAEGAVEDVLVRTRSVKEETRYASVAVVRRAWIVTLESQVQGTAWWQRPLDYDVRNAVVDSGSVAVDADAMRVVLPRVKPGVLVFRIEFDVPKPVRIDKRVTNSGWSYDLESRVPFDVSFPWVLDESVSCVPDSRDVSVAALSGGLYRFSANVTLHAFEQKTLSVQLACVAETLSNQTALLQRVPGLPSSSERVLNAVRQALASGRLDEAAWLLFQLQQPAPVDDPLEKYRWLSTDAAAARLLERADAAVRRGDSATHDAAVKELDAYVKAQKSALEEQIKAVCMRCPPAVDAVLHLAKSALFLNDVGDAREKLVEAQDQYRVFASEEAEQNRTRQEWFARIQSASWPALARFDAAWAVPESAQRWRARQPLYAESKQRYDGVQAAVKKLDDAARKLSDAKAVALAGLERDWKAAQSDTSALSALLDRLEADARSAVQTVEKAVQQFGTSSQEPTLKGIREAMEQGRFAAALYGSEQLTATLAQRPSSPSGPSAVTGLLGSHSLLEVGAGVGGLLVLGALAYWFHRQKKEEPLEEIG